MFDFRSSQISLCAHTAISVIYACAPMAAADVRVALRDGGTVFEGASAVVDDSGIRVKGADGIDQVASWDQVRTVSGSTAPESIDAQLKLGELLWRARTRVLRGDYELAEPLLHEAWRSLREPRQHELGYLAAEGLLRCALARGDSVGALEPWIHMVAMHAAGRAPLAPPFSSLGPILDAGTLFSREIAPFATPEIAARAAQVLETRVGAVAGGPSTVDRFARLLRGAPEHVQPTAGASVAEQLLASLEELALAETERDRARLAEGFFALACKAGGGEAPRFLLAWSSMVLGRSLVAQTAPTAQEIGVLELLTAAVIEGESALGRLALSEAAAACRARGDSKSAAIIERIHAENDLSVPILGAAQSSSKAHAAAQVAAAPSDGSRLKGNETP